MPSDCGVFNGPVFNKSLNCSISHPCPQIVYPKATDRFDAYVDLLMKIRAAKGKELARNTAADMVSSDINMFGTLMVRC